MWLVTLLSGVQNNKSRWKSLQMRCHGWYLVQCDNNPVPAEPERTEKLIGWSLDEAAICAPLEVLACSICPAAI